MASIQLRVLGELTAAPPATPAAISDRVSPRVTVWEVPAASLVLGAGAGVEARAARAGREGAAAGAGAGLAASAEALAAGADAAAGAAAAAAGSLWRAIAPSRAPGLVLGAATGALATADSPGV